MARILGIKISESLIFRTLLFQVNQIHLGTLLPPCVILMKFSYDKGGLNLSRSRNWKSNAFQVQHARERFNLAGNFMASHSLPNLWFCLVSCLTQWDFCFKALVSNFSLLAQSGRKLHHIFFVRKLTCFYLNFPGGPFWHYPANRNNSSVS